MVEKFYDKNLPKMDDLWVIIKVNSGVFIFLYQNNY